MLNRIRLEECAVLKSIQFLVFLSGYWLLDHWAEVREVVAPI